MPTSIPPGCLSILAAMKPLPHQMDSLAPFIHTVSPYLDQYGYLAIFFGILLESFGIPAPGATLLVAGALFSSLGGFEIQWVLLLGFCAAVIGDNIGYAIGRYAGRPAVWKYGGFVFLSKERVHKIENLFARHGGTIVIVARFVDGLRQFNGIIAGLSHMDWKRFFLFNATGAALWVGVWGTVAYLLGSRLGMILTVLGHLEKYLFAIIALSAFLAVSYVLIKKFTK